MPLSQSTHPVSAFMRLGRLKFVLEGVLIVTLGVCLAVADGHSFDLRWCLVTMLFACCTLLMTHYCNEYFDLDADRANEESTSWSGGSRVLVSGLLSPGVSLSAAFVLLFVCAVMVSLLPDATARLLGVAIMALSWFYTAPPLRLNYHGLGELAAATVSYGFGPFLAYYLQGPRIAPVSLLLFAALFAFQFLRLTVMNLFDVAGDRIATKRTLAVILGEPRLVRLYIVGQVIIYLGITFLVAQRLLPAPVGIPLLLTAAAPVWISKNLRTGTPHDSGKRNVVTFVSSLHLPMCAIAVVLGLLVDS